MSTMLQGGNGIGPIRRLADLYRYHLGGSAVY